MAQTTSTEKPIRTAATGSKGLVQDTLTVVTVKAQASPFSVSAE